MTPHTRIKTESCLQPAGPSHLTERIVGPAIRLPDSQTRLVLLTAIQFCSVQLGNMRPIFDVFCSTPPPHSSLALYLGHKGTAFSRQRPESLLSSARYVIENIEMD